MKFPETATPEWLALRRKLLTVSQFVAFLPTALGGLYSKIAPPDDDLKFWPSYASLLAGLVFLVCKRFGKPRRIIMWVAIAFAAIVPVYYFVEYRDLVVRYVERKLICGTQYKPRGADYVAQHPNISKKDLVFAFGGELTDIWTEDSINRAHLRLGVIYSGGLAFLALALLTALQEPKEPKEPSVVLPAKTGQLS